MSTITIPASEVKAGDVIDFGGQPATIVDAEPHADVPDVMQVKFSGLWTRIPDAYGIASISAGLLLTVFRPDHDAELVEVMARAMGDRIEVHWRMDDFDQQTPADQENTRRDVRAALAAAREAGLL